MKTADLLIELVVIGVGAALILILLLFSLFGFDWVPWDNLQNLAVYLIVPVLAIFYTLGVVVDRLTDYMFSVWDDMFRAEEFPDSEKYYLARTYVYTYAPENIIALFEQTRSRIRISRAWCIHFALLGILSPIFVITELPRTAFNTQLGIAIFSFLFFALSAVATWSVWKNLSQTYYIRLTASHALLRGEQGEQWRIGRGA